MVVAHGSVMTRLREETAAQHAHAESRPLEQALVRGVLPRAAFVALLGQRFLVHRALEARLRELVRGHPLVGTLVPERLFQEQNARDDLAFFGVDAATVESLAPTHGFIAEIDRVAAGASPLALLGFYYVLEGSKNGARFIAQRVRPAYGLTAGPGTRYLDPHGEEQRPLWAAFKQRMDAAGFDTAAQDTMVAAARRAFDALSAIDDAVYADYGAS
jgi:heme oxygenase